MSWLMLAFEGDLLEALGLFCEGRSGGEEDVSLIVVWTGGFTGISHKRTHLYDRYLMKSPLMKSLFLLLSSLRPVV